MSELIRSETVEALHRAAELARQEPSFLYGLTGAGPIGDLEDSVKRHLGVSYALAVSSGTAALHTSLVACGVRAGDEVIVPAYTWPQTVSPVLQIGAVPVVVDVLPETFTIDPVQVSKAVTKRSRAVLAVHMFGLPADLRELTQICTGHGLSLIEDAAHAFGAAVDDKPVGAWGSAACFSLGKSKPFSGGEGGLLTTNSEEVFRRAVAFSQHPLRQAFEGASELDIGPFGLNYRMHPLAAVIAASELRFAEHSRMERDAWVRRLLKGGAFGPSIKVVTGESDTRHAWYRMPLSIQRPCANLNRARLIEMLAHFGVQTSTGPMAKPMDEALADAGARYRSLPCPEARLLWQEHGIVCEIRTECNPQALAEALRELGD